MKRYSERSRRRRVAGACISLCVLSAGLDASATDLLDAARRNDGPAATRLLRAGANPGARAPSGESALQWAAHHDNAALVRALLAAGARPGANHYGETDLQSACVHGGADTIGLLLAAGADPQAAGPSGVPPLLLAAKSGRADAVRLLLELGASVASTESDQGQTALMWAAAEGNADAMQVLLRAGAEVDAKSRGGFNALHFAARQGQLAAAKLLLAHSAKVDAPAGEDGGGPTALGLAVTNAHFELAATLLSAGANPNRRWRGHAAIHVLTWVMRPGIGTNDPPPQGSGRLDRLDLLRELVRHGADVNLRMESRRANGLRTQLNLKGGTPFLLAARTADVEMMRLLVELGADPRAANEDGTTPLLAAAGVGVHSPEEDPGTIPEVVEAVRLAVELGNDVNAVDRRGETALHGAAYKYAAPIVPYLLGNGARIEVWNRKNANGWTPLRIATGVHRTMNLRSSPETAEALRQIMQAAGVSTELEPETNISGATN